MPTGQKHLVKCRCILPQYRSMDDPPLHEFVVFSVINDDNVVVQKYAQCNSCSVVHRVTDLTRSEIVHGKEAMSTIKTVDDIKPSLPPNLSNILESNNVDLPTWEMAQFIYESEQWGKFVVLATDVDEGMKQGKYLRILGKNLFKVEAFSRNEYVGGKGE